MSDRQVIWPGFTYGFSYELDFGWEVQVNVDHLFERKKDLEILGRFPIKQRKAFANHVMERYKEEKYRNIKQKDLINPFALSLTTIFRHGIQIYWIKCPNNTVLIFSGLEPDENFNSDSGSETDSDV